MIIIIPKCNQLGRVILPSNVKIFPVYLYQRRDKGKPNAYSVWIWMQTAPTNGRNGENQIRYGVNTLRRRREKIEIKYSLTFNRISRPAAISIHFIIYFSRPPSSWPKRPNPDTLPIWIINSTKSNHVSTEWYCTLFSNNIFSYIFHSLICA